MTVWIAVVCESPADFTTGSQLLDRILQEQIAWLSDQDDLTPFRRFVGETTQVHFVEWRKIKQLARDLGIRAQGRFECQPAEPDAKVARRAILALERLHPDLSAIVLLRDADRSPERRLGLEQARDLVRHRARVIIGLADPNREAWVISGFEPKSPQEQQRLDSECQRLKFDPRTCSERLNASGADEDRNAKRVLAALTQEDSERQAECWRVTPLDILRQRGAGNGLKHYFDDLQHHLVPLFGKP